jgi:bla regulator protein blaR1
MIEYLIKVALFQSIFYLIYHLMFRKNTFFNVNRFYILFAVVISFALPFIKFGQSPVTNTGLQMLPEVFINAGQAVRQSTTEIIYNTYSYDYIYLAVAVLFMLYFIVKIIRLISVIKSSRRLKNNGYVLVNINNNNKVFSWFKYIFSGHNELEKDVIEHELVHIRKGHSYDLLIMEIAKTIMWINPFIYFFEMELKLVHEYEADSDLSKSNEDDYALMLLSKTFGVSSLSFVHNFVDAKQLKKRIKMIKKMKTKKIVLLRYLLIIPVLALFSFEYTSQNVPGDIDSQDVNIFENKDVELKISNDTIEEEVFNFQIVEIKPVYKGCENLDTDAEKEKCFNTSIFNHVRDNFVYPKKAKEDSIQGRVIVSFVIEKDGNIGRVKILRGVHKLLDDQASNLIKSIPKMTPAMSEGKPVAVQFMLPITFRLDKKVKKEESSLNFLNEKKSPLIIVDGEEVEKSKFEEIDPKSIDAITVYKDEPAIEQYGDKGKNGVIVVTLKK